MSHSDPKLHAQTIVKRHRRALQFEVDKKAVADAAPVNSVPMLEARPAEATASTLSSSFWVLNKIMFAAKSIFFKIPVDHASAANNLTNDDDKPKP
ncbi:MAG: hypothetical protein ACHP65_00970 [Legionellales bacterium]